MATEKTEITEIEAEDKDVKGALIAAFICGIGFGLGTESFGVWIGVTSLAILIAWVFLRITQAIRELKQ